MTTTEIWKNIEKRASDVIPVFVEGRIRGFIAIIKQTDSPNVWWIGETVNMVDFNKVERICQY